MYSLCAIDLPFLRGLFGEAVLGPIQWHVDAKRDLCATRSDYFDGLSADSVRSLTLQGGIFTPTATKGQVLRSRLYAFCQNA